MQFYPIVYTRTNQTIYGLDFHYKARTRVFDDTWRGCVTNLINEDNFPRMKGPRRIFVRTQSHLFWGLALHNKWFLPQEIQDRLKMEIFGSNVRGFWGGLMELGSLSHEEEQEALRLIASSLVKDKASVNTSDEQEPAENLDLGLDLPQAGLYSRQSSTDFHYACKLFQKYIEQDWNNHNQPVYREESERKPKSPVIADVPEDLASMVVECDLTNFTNSEILLPEEKNDVANMIPAGEYDEETAIVQAILSGKPCAIVTGIEKSEHALRFLNTLPSLNVFVDEVHSRCQVTKPKQEEKFQPEPEPEPKTPPKAAPKQTRGFGQGPNQTPRSRFGCPNTQPESDDARSKGFLDCGMIDKFYSFLDHIFALLKIPGSRRSVFAPNNDVPATPTPEDEVKRFSEIFANTTPTDSNKEHANDDLE